MVPHSHSAVVDIDLCRAFSGATCSSSALSGSRAHVSAHISAFFPLRRRLVAQMLPRYGRLLTCGELAALRRFEPPGF